MSTIKISQLDAIHPLNSNTDNVSIVGVDTESGVTGRYTATTLADGLYANKALNVGNNSIVFPGVIGQFVGTEAGYLQINLQNKDGTGSSDFVVTANNGTDETWFADFGLQGSELEQGVLKPLDAYVLVQGNGSSEPGANLIIGSLTENRDIIFTQGGYETDNVVAKFVYNTGLQLTKKPLTFADGTTQNTSSVGTASSANSAYTQANVATAYAQSAGSYANSAYTQSNTATSYAQSSGSYANSAFTKANNALANTTGTFGGDLTVTGNLQINYATHIHKPDMPGNGIFLLVTGSSTGAYGVPSNPGYTIQTVSPDGVGNRVVAEAYANTSSGYASFIARRARGTASSPLPIQNGDIIARFAGNAYGDTKFSQFGDGRIEIVASGDHTDTSKPTQINFLTTLVGSNSATQIAHFNANTVTFSGAVVPAKGFVYTPRVEPDNSSLTINFADDSLVKANLSGSFSISFSNYTAGKVVEVWLVNTSGSTQTITHGCSSTNSTVNATTFSMPSTSCAHLKYFSIDGDLANTFVKVTHA